MADKRKDDASVCAWSLSLQLQLELGQSKLRLGDIIQSDLANRIADLRQSRKCTSDFSFMLGIAFAVVVRLVSLKLGG